MNNEKIESVTAATQYVINSEAVSVQTQKYCFSINAKRGQKKYSGLTNTRCQSTGISCTNGKKNEEKKNGDYTCHQATQNSQVYQIRKVRINKGKNSHTKRFQKKMGSTLSKKKNPVPMRFMFMLQLF